MRSKIGFLIAVTALLVVMLGCGRDNPPPPIPQPAPAPSPNPNTNPFPGYNVGSCSGVPSQFPFSQQPFLGRLQGSQGGTIQLTLGYHGYVSGASASQAVVGSALVNLPELSYLSGGYGGQVNPAASQVCATSAGTGGQAFPGIYVPYDRSLAITLYGIAQVPLYNPYNPYPSGQFTQTPVEVIIGDQYPGCGAVLYDQRLVGCVGIRLGQGGQVYWYSSY